MLGREVRTNVTLWALLLLACSVSLLKGQDYDPNGKPHEDKGATASELVSGASTSISGMVKLDTRVGWNFTKNLGYDVGVPYLLDTRPGIFTGTSGRIGYVDYPYIGCRFFFGCYSGVTSSASVGEGTG